MTTGTIFEFAGQAAPEGALPCNGQVVAQADYPELFAVIGTTWNTTGGAADPGAGNFRLPPQTIGGNALFMRTKVAGNVLGEYQASLLKLHTHVATTDLAGEHMHNILRSTRVYRTSGSRTLGGIGVDRVITSTASGAHSHTVTLDLDGGAVSRPESVTYLRCIWT